MKNLKNFDSYIDQDNNNIIIVTKDYSEMHGENVICEHQITYDRTLEILTQLKDTLNSYEKN